MKNSCIFLMFLVMVSCVNLQKVYTDDLMKPTEKAKIIYLSDLNYRTDSLFFIFSEFEKKNRDYEYYFCDCGDARNFPIIYSHDIQDLPHILYVSSNGDCSEIVQDGEDLSQWVNTLAPKSDMMDKLKYHYFLDRQNEDQIRLLRPIFTDSFYSCYLYFRLMQMNRKFECSEYFREQAIKYYEDSPDLSKVLLFRELLRDYNTEGPVVVFDSLSVDLGTLYKSGRYEIPLKYRNYSSQPLIILHSTVSCNCVEVEYDKIVEPNTEGMLKISYLAEGDPQGSAFERQIYLVTNSHNEEILITIKGTY